MNKYPSHVERQIKDMNRKKPLLDAEDKKLILTAGLIIGAGLLVWALKTYMK